MKQQHFAPPFDGDARVCLGFDDVQDLMSILAGVWLTADMNPVVGGGWGGTLHN